MKTTWYAFVPAVIWLAGCKSDLNQQLLERELRYQEDQIYQLQDELQDKCARLDRAGAALGAHKLRRRRGRLGGPRRLVLEERDLQGV